MAHLESSIPKTLDLLGGFRQVLNPKISKGRSDIIWVSEKLKQRISLSEEAELMGYFNEQKAKALALQADITRLDRDIDALVYELYGLTEEEIRIVEGG